MKFSDAMSLAAHLQEAQGGLYAVALADPTERLQILKECSKSFSDKTVIQVESEGLQKCLESLNSPSLFSERTLLIFDGIEKLRKKEMETLSQALQRLDVNQTVILGSKSAPKLENVHLLDLSKEKPWEKKSRILKGMGVRFSQENKSYSPRILEDIYEGCSGNAQMIENEIEKLLCYVHNSPQITPADIEAISSLQIDTNSWKLAEDFVWANPTRLSDLRKVSGDISALLPFIGSLRYHLQTGLKLSQSAKSGIDRAALSRTFPRIRGKTLDMYLSKLRRGIERRFEKQLPALFALEIDLKNRNVPANALADRFFAQFLGGK